MKFFLSIYTRQPIIYYVYNWPHSINRALKVFSDFVEPFFCFFVFLLFLYVLSNQWKKFFFCPPSVRNLNRHEKFPSKKVFFSYKGSRNIFCKLFEISYFWWFLEIYISSFFQREIFTLLLFSNVYLFCKQVFFYRRWCFIFWT